jgi:hypothetical protein
MPEEKLIKAHFDPCCIYVARSQWLCVPRWHNRQTVRHAVVRESHSQVHDNRLVDLLPQMRPAQSRQRQVRISNNMPKMLCSS